MTEAPGNGDQRAVPRWVYAWANPLYLGRLPIRLWKRLAYNAR